MPVDYRAPNINARSLGQQLRTIREILELSYPQAAALLGRNADWPARLETGFAPVTPAEVAEILDAYGTPPRIRDVLVDLASRLAGPPWLALHAGINGPFDVLEFPGLPDRISLCHTALGIDAAQVDLWDTWKLIEEKTLSPADSRTYLTEFRASFSRR